MQIIEKYFPSLSPVQKEQIRALQSVYTYWNDRINVISRKDMVNLYTHHVLHSLSISKIIDFNPGTSVMDAGTGGGFPGIPLAICFPQVEFILIDSIAKKIKVVEAVIHDLGLKNCETVTERIERNTLQVDFVTARAVTDISTLLKWTRKNVTPGGSNALKNGLIALKGGELGIELNSVSPEASIFNISDYFSEPFFETKKLVYIPR
jgi:16S rRNA (guanine527-N7)-methyltransferase